MWNRRGASVFEVTPRWCAEQQREPRYWNKTTCGLIVVISRWDHLTRDLTK